MKGILIYILIMGFAIYLGKKGVLKKILKDNINRLQNILVFILLFFMGVILGKNKEVINSISKIGLQAIFMSFMIIIFSVLSVKIANVVYEKIKKRKVI